MTRAANEALGRWVAASRTAHRIEELQLAAGALAASRGVTGIHQMAMPREEGDDDLEVFLRHRDRLPVDATVLVASTDIPRIIDLGLPAIGATSRRTARSGPGRRRCWSRTRMQNTMA